MNAALSSPARASRTLTGFVLFALLTGAVSAQTLAHSVPADTLVYFRQTDPLTRISKLLGNSLVFSSPVDVQKDFLDGIDKAMGMADGFLGMEVGSLSTYLRSITNVEGALSRLELTDGFPEVDFVLVFQTPMADKIYALLSGKLIEEQLGTDLGNGETEIDIMGQFGMSLGQKDDKLVLASDQRRLRDTMKTFGSTAANCLAQSAQFQAAVPGSIDNCLYLRVDTFAAMGREAAQREGGRGAGMVLPVLDALGIFKIGALGYKEDEATSRLAVLANGAIPLFDILAADGGDAEMLHSFPADTAFAAVWCGNMVNHWKKGSAFLLDKSKFPGAQFVEEGIRTFQKEIGLKAEEIAAVADGGMAFGFMPDGDGRLDDDPQHFAVLFRTSDTAKMKEVAAKLGEAVVRRRKGEVLVKEEGGVTWYEYVNSGSSRPIPGLAVGPDLGIVAVPEVARRILAIRAGQGPSLRSVDATKGLKPGAAGYWFVGIKTIMAQSRELSSGYGLLRDGAGIAGAIEMTPERMVMTTNQPIGQVMNSFAVAGMRYETQDAARRAALKDLEEIAKAYRLYRGQNNGKDPATLAALGFEGEKALQFPPKRPASQPGKPYVLCQVGTVGETEEWRTIVAYAPDNSLGRLVACLDGSTRTLSEVEFRRRLTTQTRRLTEAAPEGGEKKD